MSNSKTQQNQGTANQHVCYHRGVLKAALGIHDNGALPEDVESVISMFRQRFHALGRDLCDLSHTAAFGLQVKCDIDLILQAEVELLQLLTKVEIAIKMQYSMGLNN
jgi:hypothetical protein